MVHSDELLEETLAVMLKEIAEQEMKDEDKLIETSEFIA